MIETFSNAQIIEKRKILKSVNDRIIDGLNYWKSQFDLYVELQKIAELENAAARGHGSHPKTAHPPGLEFGPLRRLEEWGYCWQFGRPKLSWLWWRLKE